MSEIKGTEGFERPDEKELQDYLKQSRKSLAEMKEGKPPIFFKPKKRISTKLIGIVILITFSSLLIIFPMLSNQIDPTSKNNNTTNQYTSSTFTSSPSSTGEPDSSSLDLQMAIYELESIIYEMISSDLSSIYPEMINGTINTSCVISINELQNLIWYLNQFDQDSNWWNLGRELLINNNNLWGESVQNIEDISVQLQTLRGLLAYSQHEIALNSTNQQIYDNTCRVLWDKIIKVFDNSSNTLSSPLNNSLRFASDQILFIEILTSALSHSNLYNQEKVQNYLTKMVDSFDQVIRITNGLPDSFYSNRSWISPIYTFKHQGELLLALERLNTVFEIVTIDSILNRVDGFISNYFVKQDWSCSPKFNITSLTVFTGAYVQDQTLLIRTQVMSERLTYAKYTANKLRNLFSAPNNGFYSSLEDRETQSLMDQIYILLTFHELLELDSELMDYAGALWGVEFMLLALILLLVKRGYSRRRDSLKKLQKK
ncbi:MAG: hypothetical protein ACFE9L_12975 [Candidatus Hodarchaeota archaeon]